MQHDVVVRRRCCSRSGIIGIHEVAFKAIQACNVDLRRELFDHVVLCGGSTLFRGLPERLTKELDGLAPRGVKSRVVALKNRKLAAWIGGAIYASRTAWVTKAKYDEAGPDALVLQR